MVLMPALMTVPPPMPQKVVRNSFSRMASLFRGSKPMISWPKSLTMPMPALWALP